MLKRYIKGAICDIDRLITLTKTDIEAIKATQHEKLADHLREKEALILAFENKKSLLNSELVERTQKAPDKGLEELLDEEEQALLEKLKKRLQKLKKVNKRFARYVASISEFYNTMLDRLFALDSSGYEKTTPKPASILKVSA